MTTDHADRHLDTRPAPLDWFVTALILLIGGPLLLYLVWLERRAIRAEERPETLGEE